MGCISFLVKNLVFVVNFVFAVAGLALLILGCVFKFAYVNKLSTDTIPSALNVVSILVIIVGSLVFVTSFLGCCGAIRNSVCMLRLYAAILLAFFIIQLTIGIYAFVKIKDSDFKNDVKEALDKSFQKYDSKNNQYKDAIDILQQSVAGLALLILGCVLKFAYVNKLSTDTIPSALNVASILVIIVGGFVFITSFLGCCGAIKSSAWMLRVYAAILLTLFIIQFAIGVYALVKIKDADFKSDLEEVLDESFQKYEKESKYKEAIDILQENMECCGLNNASTWDHLGVPPSCCARSKPCSTSSNDFYTKGCFDELFSSLGVAFNVLGYVIIGIGATELLGAIFGCYLSRNIDN